MLSKWGILVRHWLRFTNEVDYISLNSLLRNQILQLWQYYQSCAFVKNLNVFFCTHLRPLNNPKTSGQNKTVRKPHARVVLRETNWYFEETNGKSPPPHRASSFSVWHFTWFVLRESNVSSVVVEVGLCIWMEHTDPCDMRTEELRLVRRRAIRLIMHSTGLPFELKPNPRCK